MLKEFIEHIQKTTQPLITTVNGSAFCVTSDGKEGQLTVLLDVDKQLIFSTLHVFSHKKTAVFMVANMYHPVLGPLTRFQSDGHIQHIFVLLLQVLFVFC